MKRTLPAVLLAIAALGVALPGLALAHGWQPAVELTRGRSVIDYRTAADGRGDVLALVQASGTPTGDRVELFRRPPGGTFGEAAVVGPARIHGRERALAAGRQGHAVALWSAPPQPSQEPRLFASFREPGAAFGPVEEVPLGGRAPFRVEAAVAPDGTALIALSSTFEGRFEVSALVRHPDGRFEGPTRLAPTDRFRTSAQVAVDAAGNATFLWSLNRFRSRPGAVEVATRPAGGGLSPPVRISARREDARRFPMLAVGPEGHAVAAWHVNVRGRGLRLRAAVRRIGAARFERPRTVSTTRAGEATVAAGSDGALLLAYRLQRRRGGSEHARATFFSPRRGWLPSEALSRAWSEVADPNAGFSADGDAIVAWTRLNRGRTPAVEAAVRPRGGRFARAERVSGARRRSRLDDVQLAVTPGGEAVAFWSQLEGGWRLLTATYAGE